MNETKMEWGLPDRCDSGDTKDTPLYPHPKNSSLSFTIPSTYRWRSRDKGDIFGTRDPLGETHDDTVEVLLHPYCVSFY